MNKSHWSVYDADSGFAFAWFLVRGDAEDFLALASEGDPNVRFEIVRETRAVMDLTQEGMFRRL